MITESEIRNILYKATDEAGVKMQTYMKQAMADIMRHDYDERKQNGFREPPSASANYTCDGILKGWELAREILDGYSRVVLGQVRELEAQKENANDDKK